MAKTKTVKNENEHKCSICGKKYVGYGNNAWPINDGRCCDACNYNRVIPARLYSFYSRQKEN